MWKLVIGIGLVVLLDVAFIWMVASEPDGPELAQAIGPTAAEPVIHRSSTEAPIAIDDSVEPIETGFGNDPFERTVHRRRSNENVRARSTSSSVQVENPTVAATAPAKLFQDTIIWIGRTEVPVKIDNRDEVPVVTEYSDAKTMHAQIVEPRAETRAAARKRSFQSKAFSVIKKPYDWVKSVADKLN